MENCKPSPYPLEPDTWRWIRRLNSLITKNTKKLNGLNSDSKELAKQLAEEYLLGHKLNENLKEIFFVRNVAPNKDMMRISFHLTNDILFDNLSKRSLDGLQEAGIAK